MQKTYLTRLRKHIFSGPQITQIYFNRYLFPVTLLLKTESVKEKPKLFCSLTLLNFRLKHKWPLQHSSPQSDSAVSK